MADAEHGSHVSEGVVGTVFCGDDGADVGQVDRSVFWDADGQDGTGVNRNSGGGERGCLVGSVYLDRVG